MARERPEWIPNDVWTRLLEHWNSPSYRSQCIATKKNRAFEMSGALHIGGSITTHEHALRMVYILTVSNIFHLNYIFKVWHQMKFNIIKYVLLQPRELGRHVFLDEVFQQTHIWKGTSEYMDERSRKTNVSLFQFENISYS